jgi:hypothetical protein
LPDHIEDSSRAVPPEKECSQFLWDQNIDRIAELKEEFGAEQQMEFGNGRARKLVANLSINPVQVMLHQNMDKQWCELKEYSEPLIGRK